MKRRPIITILAVAMILMLSLSVFTACGKNKHKFSDEWKSDESGHWHECMTKKHTDMADKAEHTFDTGVVTTPASETATGVMTFTCTVCKYQKTKILDKLEHVHTFDMGTWERDDENHWHPATCGHTEVKKDLAAHTWNEGVITTPATETEEGVKTYTCTTCGKTKTAPIGKLDHVHTFDTERWDYDTENHWHPATCGHTDEKKDLAAHVWNEGVITKEPTEAEEGVKTYTCTTCGKTKTAPIGRLDHVHTFDMDTWKHDAENHWHPATCAHTDEKKDFASHVWDDGVVTKPVDYGVEGEKTFTCTVCKATRTEPIAALEAKDNEIVLKDGKTLDKTYDGSAVDVSDKFSFNGNGEVTFMFKAKGADDNTYAATAPKNVGEYTVKVSVEGTAEWKAETKTFDFAIAKKELTGEATKTYDGNATMPATLTGVVDGETVTATITMTSKDVGATVKEVLLEGANKDNYTLTAANVTASITPMTIGVDWEKEYDNSKIITGEPAELLAGDEATITVTMESANVGAAVQSFEITGKDAANYSLAIEDVNVEIIKADIVNFTISNAAAFEEGFYVGATNIPEPTTDYVKIGTGYGEKTTVWEMQLEDGVWSRTLTKEEVRNLKSGTFRVRIQYAEGDNYNFKATEYVRFTVKAKSRRLAVKNFAGKTYDGKQVTNFTFNNLVNKFGASSIDGVENFTSATDSGEKYVEFREVGGEWGRNLNVANVLTNAAEYEYRIGVTATDEWEAVVSEIKTFTIKPYEFVLELGYGQNQHNPSYDSGKTFFLRIFYEANGNELIKGQRIELWLDNEKAGIETKEGNNSVYNFIPDQKKKVTADCFFLKIGNISNPVMENYKIVTKSPSVTTVEITVVEYTTQKSTSGPIQVVDPTGKKIYATVEKGYFKVGQTVVVYNQAGDIVGEATITEISANGTTSASGFAIPSDGRVAITLDNVSNDMLSGKIVAK